jgi:hypothetical protein
MSWARFDDGFDENEHILDLTDQEFRLYVCAITCSRRNKTAGLMSRSRAVALARKHGLPESTVAGLEAKGRWEPIEGGWMIHDFAEFGPPADLSEKRTDAARQRWQSKPDASAEQVQSKPDASAEQVQSKEPPRTQARAGTPVPVPVSIESPSDSLTPSPATGAVRRVFDEWVRAHHKNASTALDEKRRARIAAALKAYPEEDVLDAVRWTIRVEGQPYDELTLLLRDAAHIERCRDAVRAARHPAERELPRWDPPVVENPLDPSHIRDLMPASLRRFQPDQPIAQGA